MKESITDYYHTTIALCSKEQGRLEKLANTCSFMRLFTVILGMVLIYQSLKFELVWLTELTFLGLVLLFAWLVKQQSIFEKQKQYYTDLKNVNTNEINSIDSGHNMYPDGSVWTDGLHPYTSDLDIFGKASLFALLNRCASVPGNAKLARWLKAPAQVPLIRKRQAAVQELTAKAHWKQHFQTVLLYINNSNEDPADRFSKYLALIPAERSKALKLYIRFIPWVMVPLVLLAWYIPVFILALIVLGISNFLIVQWHAAHVNKTESLIGKISAVLARFSEAIAAVNTSSWTSELCLELAAELQDNEHGNLADQLKQLSVLINRLEYRLNMFIGLIFNILMVWDVRQLYAIEDWKLHNKQHIEHAFDVIASFEALISLSSLEANCPEWTYPQLAEGEYYTLQAAGIAHPLIPAATRVKNNFELKNELKIDVITGSNMAGKSTFLRTLGINIVLGLCGAPVCALNMSLSRMMVFSYMRISDSLNESTSTFKAELDRLKQLLEILKPGEKIYFLIDEMLRGTNSVDKYRGSKAIMEKLIAQQAVGIVATHDLQLANLEQKYPHYVRNFYFDIRVEGQEMLFDYKIKPGECKTFNASLLLKQLGISIDEA